MVGRIRWQIGIALVGLLIVALFLVSLARSTAVNALSSGHRTYVEGVVGVPRQLNPLLLNAASSGAERDLVALLFEGLTRPGPNGVPEPALAERWTLDDTGRVWTFTLRPDLRWHDGVAVTADDVVFTVESVQHERFVGDPARGAFWRALSVEALDDYRIRFTLPQPFAPFLAATALPILPRHLLGDIAPSAWANASFSRQPIGTGPFRLEKVDEREARLRPFEDAIRGRPALDLLVLRFFATHADARNALERRDVEGLATVAMPGVNLPESPHTVRAALPVAHYTILEWNIRQSPLDNRRLREALARGLDRERLIERLLGGYGVPLDTPFLPQTPYASAARLPATSVAMAARILDELGWIRRGDGARSQNGVPLSFSLLIADDAAQHALAGAIRQQWAALGVEVRVEAVGADAYRQRMEQRAFTLALRAWMPGTDPDLFALWHSSQAETGANEAGLLDSEIDRLIEEGRQTLDMDRRVELASALADRWTALLPSLPLYQSMLVYDIEPDVRSAGLEPARLLATPAARFDDISAWNVPDR